MMILEMTEYALSKEYPEAGNTMCLLQDRKPLVLELSGLFRNLQGTVLFQPDEQGVSKILELNRILKILVSSLPGPTRWIPLYWKTGNTTLLSLGKPQMDPPVPLEYLSTHKPRGTVTFLICIRNYHNRDYRAKYDVVKIQLNISNTPTVTKPHYDLED